jgi:hypothetical protein
MTTKSTALRRVIEKRIGALLMRGWILDGTGPARFGWGSIHPCKTRWEGRTLQDVAARYSMEVK